eukprot:382089-Rhodomonas_salina.1
MDMQTSYTERKLDIFTDENGVTLHNQSTHGIFKIDASELNDLLNTDKNIFVMASMFDHEVTVGVTAMNAVEFTSMLRGDRAMCIEHAENPYCGVFLKGHVDNSQIILAPDLLTPPQTKCLIDSETIKENNWMVMEMSTHLQGNANLLADKASKAGFNFFPVECEAQKYTGLLTVLPCREAEVNAPVFMMMPHLQTAMEKREKLMPVAFALYSLYAATIVEGFKPSDMASLINKNEGLDVGKPSEDKVSWTDDTAKKELVENLLL